ncbi:hypothetical protein [Arthrobacter sp. HMWF013]|uniref:hypothetical protein n=1 Tax=Arthrobacter sp. HMWF013 TaxID=2056849 RepID=UPI000D361640|nr:hypothetical protein [Arthrobacter sp. HMWF013]PTT70200.1 hypothetical protein DBR22_01915 [Arthrobacter sp. HMWF013]
MSRLRFQAPVAVAGILFASAGSASAAAPEHFGPDVQSGTGIADCGDFDASISGTVSTRYTVFKDADGNVTGFKQFVSAPADTWTNLETQKSIVVRGHFVQTWDAESSNLTVVGFRYVVNEASEGVTVQEVGRIVYADQSEQEILAMAGQHDISNWDLIGPVLCGALE